MNSALLRYSTTTCDVVGSSTQCITEYPAEITYNDWMAVNLWVLFFLAILTVGFFTSSFFRKTKYDSQYRN